ncbi:MAG TPA: prephenate dehydrogenase/arogenate dehydrogenase family protein [Chloroflexota bacterium]|nr:prephenate dehydrogenase/arogenate dehydrogenase family protein [Chloroflexota bacterium]
MARVAVVGLGLIGGSAALAFRAAGHQVIGYARRPETRQRALQVGAVDSAPETLAEAVQADVVLLAPPVLAFRSLLRAVAPHLPEGAVVTDAASTKADVERWALATLPPQVRWVGGHPMAGKETAGLDHADSALFCDRPWCIVPPPNADRDAVRLVTDVAAGTGARTLEIDAAAHDRAVAAVSHLPFTVSAALAATVIDADAFGDVSAVAGSGLRDMTRLASGDPTMHRDIVLTNRDNLIAALEHYLGSIQDALALLRRLPKPDDAEGDAAVAELGAYFTRLKAARDTWLDRR